MTEPTNPIVKTTKLRAYPGWEIREHADGTFVAASLNSPTISPVEKSWHAALHFVKYGEPGSKPSKVQRKVQRKVRTIEPKLGIGPGSPNICSDREQARETLTKKVAQYEKAVNDPNHFSTVSPQWILDDAAFRLRWIDCAPEGAHFQLAPLQDLNSVPMGGNFDCNIGPSKAYREVASRRGRDWQDRKREQAAR